MNVTMTRATLVAAAFTLGASTVAQASLLALETFNTYPNQQVDGDVAGNLIGKNGGTGWGGAWDAGNTVGSGTGYLNQVRNTGANFAYPNYTASTTPAASAGNYLNLAAGFGGPNFNYAERFVDTSGGGTFGSAAYLTTNGATETVVGADNTTIWGSLLHKGVGGQLWLRNGSQGDSVFGLPDSTPDALLLYKIDYAPGNDTITIWNSPDLSTWTPASPASSTASGNYAFNKVILIEAANDSEKLFDDLRFGTTAADVVPIPEPTSIAAISLAGAALLRRRRA